MLLDLMGSHCLFIVFYRVLPSFTRFYWALRSFHVFFWFKTVYTGMVSDFGGLLGFTGFLFSCTELSSAEFSLGL